MPPMKFVTANFHQLLPFIDLVTHHLTRYNKIPLLKQRLFVENYEEFLLKTSNFIISFRTEVELSRAVFRILIVTFRSKNQN